MWSNKVPFELDGSEANCCLVVHDGLFINQKQHHAYVSFRWRSIGEWQMVYESITVQELCTF